MSDEFYGVNLFGERVDVGLVSEVDKEPARTTEGYQSGGFNVFPLTDAIGEKDKRKAWVVYEQALASGMVADEIFWRVMWGVKALLLSAKTASADESGLNPFVYKKFKSCLKNWKVEELERLSESLVVGYHDARRGKGEMETMIEKILLNL